MATCRGTGAIFQPPDSPGSVLFSSRPSHLSPRRASSKAEDPEPRLPQLRTRNSPTPPTPPHPTPRSSARSLSIFQRQQPSHTRDYLDQAGNLFLPPGANKAARLLDTKQTAAPLPNTPQPVITRKMQHQAQPIISNFSWRKLI